MKTASWIFKNLFLNYRKPALEKLKSLEFCAQVQTQTLLGLVQKARSTQFGIDHGFSRIRSVLDYQKQVPVRTYEDFFNQYFKPASEQSAKLNSLSYDPLKASPFLQNITWPGFISFYSLSSGTTAGATKFLPLTTELLGANYKAALDTVAFHFLRNPNTRILDAKIFSLGGNTSLREDWGGRVKSGDLSGVTACEIPWFFRPLYFPGEKISSIQDWEEKMSCASEISLTEDISVLAGVPSWIMLFLEILNQKREFKGNLKKIWPSFELCIHGGISFEPYREIFKAWLGEDAYFEEVYAASEAFIAIQDPFENALRLMMDYGTFYEFIPVSELGKPSPTRLTIADIEVDQNYAVLLTTNGGLWSYLIGDTVRFLSKEKLLIKITGRTKFYLSAFGEHLIQEEIEAALQDACQKFKVQFVDYHVAPLFPSSESRLGKHQYLVEFVEPPYNLQAFGKVLDERLQALNEDYAAHRSQSFGMDEPSFIIAPSGFFNSWMKKKGKIGGQHKVPRISNERGTLDDMLRFLPRGVRF